MEALGINLFYLGAQIFNLLLLFFLLYRFFYKYARETLEERRTRIERGLEHAEIALQRVAEAEEEYERKLEKAEREAQEIISQAIEEAEKVKREILTEARRDTEQIIHEAEAEALRWREQMMAELHRQAADLAILTATKIIGRTLDEEIHRQLIKESLEELERNGNGGEGELGR